MTKKKKSWKYFCLYLLIPTIRVRRFCPQYFSSNFVMYKNNFVMLVCKVLSERVSPIYRLSSYSHAYSFNMSQARRKDK